MASIKDNSRFVDQKTTVLTTGCILIRTRYCGSVAVVRCSLLTLAKCYMIINPLTAGAAYIRVFIFIKYDILNMFKIKCDINQQDLKRVDLHFAKSK